MKYGILALLALVAAQTSFASRLYFPQGSEAQILNSPLGKGEVAYVSGASGESFIYVGTSGSHPSRVTDESALRGYEFSYLDRSDFVVLAVSNLTFNAATDSLVFSDFNPSVTNSYVFKISVSHKFKFDDVDFDVVKNMAVGNGSVREIVKSVSDNVVTVTIHDADGHGRLLTISNFKVRYAKYGDPDYVNDLTKKMIKIHDSASEDKTLRLTNDDFLGNWRKSILHYYDGNRGENWSEYIATNNVNMSFREIDFGRRDKGLVQFAVGQSQTDTNVVRSSVFGRDAVKYYTSDGTTDANSLRFTSITPGDEQITFTLVVSNTVFDASLLRLYASDDVENGKSRWHQVDFTLASSNPITITTPRLNPRQCYYRLSYGNSHIVVEVADTLKANRLFVKDTNGNWTNVLDIAKGGGGISPSVVTGIVESASVTNGGAKAYADATFLPLDGTKSMHHIYFSNNGDLKGSIGVNNLVNKMWIITEDDYILFGNNSSDSRLYPDESDIATSNMVERVIASKPAPSPLTGKTYDFANGSNFTKRVYTALTNVIQTLGGTVANPPAFN